MAPTHRTTDFLPLAAAAIAAAAFAQTISFGFVNFDDDVMVTANARLAPLAFATVARFFAEPFEYLYHPLVLLSLAIDRAIWGLNPAGFHATNVAIHAANAALAAVFLRRIGLDARTAAAAAAIWAVHPARIEAVAWVSSRKELMYAFFYLGALAAYAGDGKRGLRTAAAGLLGAAAMLCKPAAVTLPAVLLMLDWTKSGRATAQDAARQLPLALASAAIAWLAVRLYYEPGREDASAGWGAADAAVHGMRNAAHHLWTFAAPVRIGPLYPDAVPPALLAAAALTAGAFAFGAWHLRAHRLVAFAAASYAAMLAPSMQLLPTGSSAAPADRYGYLPGVALAALAAMGLARVAGARLRPTAIGIVSVLCIATVAQSRAWKDSESLWAHTLRLNPASRIAWNNLATMRMAQGDLGGAEHAAARGLESNPGNAELLATRAAILLSGGRAQEALRDAADGLGSKRLNARTASRLHQTGASALLMLGDATGALAAAERALLAYGGNARALISRGSARARLGESAQAERDFRDAIAREPGLPEAYGEWGRMEAQRGQYEAAQQVLSAGIATLATDRRATSTLRMNRGIVRAMAGDGAGAAKDLDEAIADAPDNADAFANRAQLRLRQGDRAGAAADMERAAALRSRRAAVTDRGPAG